MVRDWKSVLPSETSVVAYKQKSLWDVESKMENAHLTSLVRVLEVDMWLLLAEEHKTVGLANRVHTHTHAYTPVIYSFVFI